MKYYKLLNSQRIYSYIVLILLLLLLNCKSKTVSISPNTTVKKDTIQKIDTITIPKNLISHKGKSIIESAYKDNKFNAEKWLKSDKNQYAKLHPGHISKYDKIIKRYARRYGFDWRLVSAQIYAESNFNHNAKSSVGAIGLMQVMPKTAKFMGESANNMLKPDINVMIGCAYDQRMYSLWGRQTKEKDNRLAFALASYNAGRGRVLRSYDTKSNTTNWKRVHPNLPRETIDYVHKIFLKYNQYCGMTLP